MRFNVRDRVSGNVSIHEAPVGSDFKDKESGQVRSSDSKEVQAKRAQFIAGLQQVTTVGRGWARA